MTHAQYVFVSYTLTAIVLGGIGLWLWLDRRARLAELKRLEESGVRRRSQDRAGREA